VCAEVVQDDPDAVSIRVVVGNRFHAVDPFGCPPTFRHVEAALAGQRLSDHVKHSFPVAFVVMISPSDRSRVRRERVADVLAECLAGLVETDNGTTLVVRFLVQ
jgi:hypothetical protein